MSPNPTKNLGGEEGGQERGGAGGRGQGAWWEGGHRAQHPFHVCNNGGNYHRFLLNFNFIISFLLFKQIMHIKKIFQNLQQTKIIFDIYITFVQIFHKNRIIPKEKNEWKLFSIDNFFLKHT